MKEEEGKGNKSNGGDCTHIASIGEGQELNWGRKNNDNGCQVLDIKVSWTI